MLRLRTVGTVAHFTHTLYAHTLRTHLLMMCDDNNNKKFVFKDAFLLFYWMVLFRWERGNHGCIQWV